MHGRALGSDVLVSKTKVSILAVDQSAEIRAKIKEVLEYSCGKVRFLEASNGVEAVKVFLKEKPELVIIDMKISNPDSIETIHALLKVKPAAKIILVSSSKDVSFIQARKFGARDILYKPLDRVLVNNIVSKVLCQSW